MLPELLPPPAQLRRITQSLAMLDAILSPEWEYRYYSFDARWGPGEEMASMRNGEGDDWFLLLDSAGAALKGFAHESTDDGGLAARIQQQVPAAFSAFLREPAFSMEAASFCYWRRHSDTQWHKVSSTQAQDGADTLLHLLNGDPQTYQRWAESYYEVVVSAEITAAIFRHQPLTEDMIRTLNPDADPALVFAEATDIGYPVSAAASA